MEGLMPGDPVIAAMVEALRAAKAYFDDENHSDSLFDDATSKVARACELLGIQGGAG